ncbi:hypothetical protein LEP1GSC074_0158, partial [Leptospira noguchii str. Hook]
QYLIVTSGFDISNLGYNFNLKGLGTSYVDNQLSGANQKYEIYKEDISARIEKQAKANDAEKESKGFIFTILNGMNGGSGSMGQRFTQAVRSEAQSRITGAVAEATGLPASLVGALVGGSSMKDAVKAYVKDETTNAISKATGLPTWLISNQMEKMNKPKEQWYQSQEFQMVTTVAAVVAAPLTGGASLMVAMAVNAGLGAATGAAGGGLKGALAGAVGGVISTYTQGVGVNVGLSYSAENGFGASVGVGFGPATVSVGISERGGATIDVGFNKSGFNAGLSYNSKTGKASGSVGFTTEGGTGFALSYSEGDGFGASISKGFDNGVNGSLSWSQKGGVGGSIGYEVPADKNKPKDPLANKMQGAGGSLNFSQRDGVSASFNTSGGVNAGNWSQSGGFQANTNFLADKWKAEYQAEQAAIEQAKADSKAAQNKNNEETGKSVLDGAAIEVENRKRENGGDDNHYYDKDGNMRIRVTDSNGDSYYRAATPEEAHRVQNGNGLTMASDTGKPINGIYGETKNASGDRIVRVSDDMSINLKKDGSIFQVFEARGLRGSEVVAGTHDQNADSSKIKSNAWSKTEMHDSGQKGQADMYAKEGTPISIMNAKNNEFKIVSWGSSSRSKDPGNYAVVHFTDTDGVERKIQFGHLQNKIPEYIKNHFTSANHGPLTLKTGTILGYVGTTGNHWVGDINNKSKSGGKPRVTPEDFTTGPNAHTHAVFYDSPATKRAIQSTDLPSWVQSSIGWK